MSAKERNWPATNCWDTHLDDVVGRTLSVRLIVVVTSTGGIPNRAHPISVPNGSPARSGYFECAHASRCQFSARAAPAAHTSPARPVLPSRRASSSATSAPTMEGHRNPTSTGGIPPWLRNPTRFPHTSRGDGTHPAHTLSSPKLSCCTNTPLARMRRSCEHTKRMRRRSACAGGSTHHVHVDFVSALQSCSTV